MLKAKNKSLILLIPLMVILAGIVGYRYGYLVVRDKIAYIKEERALKTKTLLKQMTFIANRPEMEKKLELLKKTRKTENAKLFDGQTSSISTAALLETVKGIVMGRGGKILSERVGKSETSGRFTIITASIDATLPDSRALGDILYSIETRTPYLVVKDLDVRIKSPHEARELSVKLDISALTGGK